MFRRLADGRDDTIPVRFLFQLQVNLPIVWINVHTHRVAWGDHANDDSGWIRISNLTTPRFSVSSVTLVRLWELLRASRDSSAVVMPCVYIKRVSLFLFSPRERDLGVISTRISFETQFKSLALYLHEGKQTLRGKTAPRIINWKRQHLRRRGLRLEKNDFDSTLRLCNCRSE